MHRACIVRILGDLQDKVEAKPVEQEGVNASIHDEAAPIAQPYK